MAQNIDPVVGTRAQRWTGATGRVKQGPNTAIGRVGQLYPFVDFLDDIGVPVEKQLSKYPLPPGLRKNSTAFASTQAMFEFVSDTAREQGIDSIGWITPHLDELPLSLRSKIRGSMTLLETLQRVCRFAHLDSNRLRVWLQKQGNDWYFCHRSSLPIGSSGIETTSMMRTVATLSIIRAHLGRDWCPDRVGLEMTGSISPIVQESMGSTRFYSTPAYGWIHLPQSLLSRPILTLPKMGSEASIDDDIEPEDDLPGVLRLLVKSYLHGGAPSIQVAAAMVGRSPRSFQRDLSRLGINYRELLKSCRFESACQLLLDADISIRDIAFELGYTDPAHFTRFFENVTGMSPRKYRHLHTAAHTA